ncbi:MAG: glycosyltransferase family 2 protein [Deinococcales bacterium]
MTAVVLDHLAGNAIVGIIAFQIIALLVVLSNALVLVRPGRDRVGAPTPLVSLLVPARDEAANIQACVRSLLAQTYPNLEIIVLDDRSEDATRTLLELERARDGRLNVLAGEELPAGWTGKNWACHQLSLAARGEVLLFADADTVFIEPDAVLAIVGGLQAHRVDLLSGLPKQVLGTLGETLVVPMFYWALLSFTPLAAALLWRRAPFARAVGQLMAFRRAAYDEVGGHAAVRGDIVEDIALARRVARAGLACRIVDATTIASCRMYRSGREAVAGFAKNLFAAFGYTILPYAFVWGWLAFVALEPIVMWALHTAFPARVPVAPGLLIATFALSLVQWVVAYARLRLPAWPAFLYPLTMIVFLAVAIRSFVDAVRRRTAWKGRRIARPRLRCF